MRKPFLVAAALLGSTAFATAHVTLKTKEAEAGSRYEAVFRVGHGCAGAPTIAIRVRVPDGVVAVEPEAKPGWAIETKTGPYPQPYEVDGATLREGATEVRWTGGNLPDGKHAEFAMRVYLTKGLADKERVFFPVVQECTGGKTERWIDTQAGADDKDESESPAPSVSIVPKD